MTRLRSKVSLTIAKSSLDVIEELIRTHQAPTASEAVDILANQFMLSGGFGKDQVANQILSDIQSRKAIIIKDMEKDLDELITTMVDEKLAQVKTVTETATRDEEQETVVGVTPMDELFRACNATSAEGIEMWAGQHITQIGATGNSLDAFVCQKLMKVQEAARTQAFKEYKEKLPATGESEGAKWVRHTSEAMVQYWRTYLDNNTMLIETKMFQVARYSKAVMGLVQKMNNGQKEEYLLTVVDQLRSDAEQRKWDTEKYVREWKTIYDNADTILKRNQDVN